MLEHTKGEVDSIADAIPKMASILSEEALSASSNFSKKLHTALSGQEDLTSSERGSLRGLLREATQNMWSYLVERPEAARNLCFGGWLSPAAPK